MHKPLTNIKIKSRPADYCRQ